MSVYKRFSLCFVASFLLFVVGFGGFLALLWLYDPFWFFHKPIFREITYHSDMRMQAKGIIDNTDFDSVILGTSMLENTSAKEASTKLGGKWVNLSMAGSDFNERKFLLDYILKHKNIRKIVFSVDAYVLLNGDRENFDASRIDEKIYSQDSFNYLYKKYLDKKFIKCAKKWSNKAECVGDKKDLETVAQDAYRSESKHFGGFKNWAKWLKDGFVKEYNAYLENDFHPKSEQKIRLNFTQKQEYLQETLFKMLAENSNIEFYLIYPPYSRFLYALFPFDPTYHKGRTGKEIFIEIKEILPYVVGEIAKFKNAKIYGFDTLSYADDIRNYIDHSHYNFDMNSMQLDAIANSTHILTPQNIDEYLQTMENKIKAYDLTPLINEIKAWEAEQNATAKE